MRLVRICFAYGTKIMTLTGARSFLHRRGRPRHLGWQQSRHRSRPGTSTAAPGASSRTLSTDQAVQPLVREIALVAASLLAAGQATSPLLARLRRRISQEWLCSARLAQVAAGWCPAPRLSVTGVELGTLRAAELPSSVHCRSHSDYWSS